MADHACPCGCGRGVSANRLACPAGWSWLQRIRPDLADEVTSSWTKRRRRTLSAQERHVATRDHRAAVGAAVRWFRAQREATL